MMNGLYVKDVKKIAILRANALGDFLVTLPAIQAIKSAYPKAELILLGKPWHKEFLSPNRSPIDRVIVVPVKKGIREEPGENENMEELNSFFEEMRKEKFDIVLHFQGKGIAANPFIKEFRSPLTVGLVSEESEGLDRSVSYYYYQSEVIRYLEIAGLIGASPVSLEPEIHVLKEDREELERTIGSFTEPYIVVHPCGTDGRRMWEEEKFTELADVLAGKGFQIVFSGSKKDRKMVEGIVRPMKNKAINTCGKLSLGGLTALLDKSNLVISIDTGPLHLARSVGAKTVGLYWAPNLINWGPLTRSKHRPVISWIMECPDCGIIPNSPFPFEPTTENCNHPYSFLRGVEVEDVLKNAESLLLTEKISSEVAEYE